MGVAVFDIVDIALSGALEQHPGKRVDESVLSQIRSDCGGLEASAFQPFTVQPDMDSGALMLTFERQRGDESEAFVSAFSSGTPCVATHMDGGYSLTFTYGGVFQ